ncbi:MAG: hypothetical protein AB7P03_21430 [Kofleriaceae bacterium]
MKRIDSVLRSAIAVSALAWVGVGSAQAQPGAQLPRAMPTESEPACPRALQGAELTLAPADSGVSLEFTSPRRAHVKELRQIVRDMVSAVQLQLAELATSTEVMPPSHAAIPQMTISIADVGSGARVTVRAVRNEDVRVLRRLALEFDQFWAQFDCVVKPNA